MNLTINPKRNPTNSARWALVVVLGVLVSGVIPSSARADENDGGLLEKIFKAKTAHSFSGVWDTMSLQGLQRTLKLDQLGSKVSGKYSPGNGKVEGKVKNGVLRVQWKEDGDKTGSARFVLSENGQVLSGVSNTTADPDADGAWWNGVRHEKQNFGGQWNLVSAGAYKYSVLLQQNGDKVSGTFAPGNGRIFDGKIKKDQLSFQWTQDGGYKGDGNLRLSDDGQSFNGIFNIAEGPAKGVNTVRATRAPVSFQGEWTWRTTGGEDVAGNSIFLDQKGEKVNPGEDISGTVIGKTLFLNWGATGLNHNAILTMNPDGKSFGGIFNSGGGGGEQGMATVGTFIRLEFNKK